MRKKATMTTDVKLTSAETISSKKIGRLSPEELRNIDAYWRACKYLGGEHDLPAS